jgi:hypothetical protein
MRKNVILLKIIKILQNYMSKNNEIILSPEQLRSLEELRENFQALREKAISTNTLFGRISTIPPLDVKYWNNPDKRNIKQTLVYHIGSSTKFANDLLGVMLNDTKPLTAQEELGRDFMNFMDIAAKTLVPDFTGALEGKKLLNPIEDIPSTIEQMKILRNSFKSTLNHNPENQNQQIEPKIPQENFKALTFALNGLLEELEDYYSEYLAEDFGAL